MKILVSLLLIYLFLNTIFRWSSTYKNISLYINVFILSIISGTTYTKSGIMTDYNVYKTTFNSASLEFIPNEDIGFYYLNLLIKNFTNEFNIAFFIFILIINFLIIKTIYRYSNNIEFSILMYVIMGGYFTSINIIKQFIALAIYFYSVKYLLEKKYIKYFIMGFIAYQFHITSLVPFVLSLIIIKLNKKIDKNYLIYCIFVNSIVIIEPIITKIGIDLFYEGNTSGGFFYGSSILHYVVQLAFILFYILKRKKVKTEETKFFINLATLASTFVLLSRNMVLYARIGSYFNIFNIIATTNIMSQIDNKKEKTLLYYCIFIGLFIYYVTLTTKSLNIESYIVDYFN